MDRPREINRFAGLALAACLINVGSTLIVLDFAKKGLLATAVGAAIAVGLILWVARWRSPIGRVVLTIWLGFGIGAGLAGYAMILLTRHVVMMSPVVHALSLVTLALNCAALVLLWSRAASVWLQQQADAS
ncbi:MAG TPA: hypothetical protein VK533_02135 [Sphingomonas sp.]|uniref:hypothetical protein n=1 Tax=Sphingomonas sp. TaxID=28214 RepID=UPI002CDAB107|nr:hypothetical protein [Sphingomonas sp.]HMI18324.1 hypothetical protein [Sphingomonas sp.]